MSPTASPRIPAGKDVALRVAGRVVQLTNLDKTFWPELGLTKRDLLQYYADIAPVLLPHLADRAMVMKRYPDGIHGQPFFMKRVPTGHPDWIETCTIAHKRAGQVPFPMVQDLASLLWVVNLGCIDLNPWYARCDDTDRPDYLHFDLDPGQGASFSRVLETALVVREVLEGLGMKPLAKTSGASGTHIYVPIVRGPLQKEVWRVAKTIAWHLAETNPKLITAEYLIAKRPRGRVLVDYNQNAWGRTLASIYSVRPTKAASVSTPVSWREVERGVRVDDFRMDNVPERVRRLGDLWKPLLLKSGRFRLERLK
ncbi:MAG TPA: non-homologous end-joining DNA ligase [Gemmatimonadales bacterium]|jgi:bifunctional non-homologous end joining protein LigD